jgi:hypothetical protein
MCFITLYFFTRHASVTLADRLASGVYSLTINHHYLASETKMNNLPIELFLQIVSYLHLIDLQLLAQVNQRFAALTRPQRLSTLRLNRNLKEIITEIRNNPSRFQDVKELIMDFPSGFRVTDHEAGTFSNQLSTMYSSLPYYRSLGLFSAPSISRDNRLASST